MEGVVKWVAVAVAVFIAWRWLGGMFSGGVSGNLNAYTTQDYPITFGGNPGVVAMYGPMVSAPQWGRVQGRVRPRRGDSAGWRAAY